MDTIHSKLFSSKNTQVSSLKIEGSLPITISNQITLPRAQLPPAIIHFLKDELNFLNSECLTKRRLGKSTYKVQKYFKLIEEAGDTILLPRGFLNQLLAFLDQNHTTYVLYEDNAILNEITFNNDIELTPVQTAVVEQAIAHNQGVIVAPSGSGKTMMGLELTA